MRNAQTGENNLQPPPRNWCDINTRNISASHTVTSEDYPGQVMTNGHDSCERAGWHVVYKLSLAVIEQASYLMTIMTEALPRSN